MLPARVLAHSTPSGPHQQGEGPLARILCNYIGLTSALSTCLVYFLFVYSVNLMCYVLFHFNFLYASRPHVTIPIYTPSLVSVIIHMMKAAGDV